VLAHIIWIKAGDIEKSWFTSWADLVGFHGITTMGTHLETSECFNRHPMRRSDKYPLTWETASGNTVFYIHYLLLSIAYFFHWFVYSQLVYRRPSVQGSIRSNRQLGRLRDVQSFSPRGHGCSQSAHQAWNLSLHEARLPPQRVAGLKIMKIYHWHCDQRSFDIVKIFCVLISIRISLKGRVFIFLLSSQEVVGYSYLLWNFSIMSRDMTKSY